MMELQRRNLNPGCDGRENNSSTGATSHSGCCCWCSCCQDQETRENWRELDLHGVRSMMRRSSSKQHGSRVLRRTFWVVVMLTSLGGFVYTASDSLFVFLSNPNINHYYSNIPPPSRPLLPSLTICNLNPLRLTELAKQRWPTESTEGATAGHVDPSSWTAINVSSSDVFSLAGHRLDKLLIRCSSDTVLCSKENFTKVLTDKGVCYTIHPNASVLRLVLNAEVYQYTGFGRDGVGIAVLLVQRNSGPPESTYTSLHPEILLAPGVQASIRLRQADVTHFPATSNCNPSVEETHQRCLSNCLDDGVEGRCNCRPFWLSSTNAGKQRPCSIKQHINCVLTKLDELLRNLPDSCSMCDVSCKQREIHWDYSHSDPIPDSRVTERSRRLRASAISDATLAAIADERCAAINAVARTSREISREDNEQIAELSSSLDAVGYQIEELQVNFRKVSDELDAYLSSLRPRLAFHVRVGLSGLRKSFVSGFADRFDLVRERSLMPLVDGRYEVLSQLERNVKQLMFTSLSEPVARKVLYYMTDNTLSGKLEIAIEAMDNFTKVYDSFLNSEPASSPEHTITPEGRYDSHLIPYAILGKEQNSLKKYYHGISENIAGLITHIVSLKGVLKDVYQSNNLNETTLEISKKAYLHRTLQIKQFTALFQEDMVRKTVDLFDKKSEELKHLNKSLHAEAAIVFRNFATQESVASGAFSETYSSVLAFSQLAQQYLRDPEVQKSSLVNQDADKVARSAMHSLEQALGVLKQHAVHLRHSWKIMEEGAKSIWSRFLDEDLLRNFYLNIYNDVTDMVNHPQRAERFRGLFFHPSMLGSMATPAGGTSSTTERTRSSAMDFNVLLNADVPVTTAEVKMKEIGDKFRRFSDQTNVDRLLDNNDQRLLQAFNRLKNSLASMHLLCQPSESLIRENIVIVEFKILNDATEKPSNYPAYTLTTFLAHIGGLLALFLGASVITCIEVVDVTLQTACSCACGRNEKKQARRKSSNDNSNHVLFRPVDILDDGVTSSATLNFSSATLNFSSQGVKLPPPANFIPKIKIDATNRGKQQQQQHKSRFQSETDI